MLPPKPTVEEKYRERLKLRRRGYLDGKRVNDDDCINLSGPILTFIKDQVFEILKAVNTGNLGNFPAFKAFWRDRFDEMGNELASRGEIDLFISDPPLKLLEIEILDYNRRRGDSYDCVCCLPYHDAHIVINDGGGISRGMFLRAIRDALYGQGLNRKALPFRRKYSRGLVVKDWMCMEDMRGCFCKGYIGHDTIRLWMYCTGLDESENLIPKATKT